MQQEKLDYPVSFLELRTRYNLKQPALSHRIKSLGLKTQRRGKNTFLTVKQLAVLDELHNFLKENPTQTIKNFLDSRSTNESPINSSLDTDASLMHQSIGTLEDRVLLIEQEIQRFDNENSIKNKDSLTNGATDESLMNNSVITVCSDERGENDARENQINELKEEKAKLQEQLQIAQQENYSLLQQNIQIQSEKRYIAEWIKTRRFCVIQIQDSSTGNSYNSYWEMRPVNVVPPSTPILVLRY